MARKRYSTSQDRIKALGSLVGMNYTKKTCDNIKAFLEKYAYFKSDYNILNIDMTATDLWKEAPDLFAEMSSSTKINLDKIHIFLAVMIRTGQMDSLLDYSMKAVRSFEVDGEVYYKILYNLYFSDEILSDGAVELLCEYSHTTYHVKKKEAIMLFGITFWSKIYEHWDNSIEEMETIEESLGRDGSLSKGAKKLTAKEQSEGKTK